MNGMNIIKGIAFATGAFLGYRVAKKKFKNKLYIEYKRQ